MENIHIPLTTWIPESSRRAKSGRPMRPMITWKNERQKSFTHTEVTQLKWQRCAAWSIQRTNNLIRRKAAIYGSCFYIKFIQDELLPVAMLSTSARKCNNISETGTSFFILSDYTKSWNWALIPSILNTIMQFIIWIGTHGETQRMMVHIYFGIKESFFKFHYSKHLNVYTWYKIDYQCLT